MSDQFKLLGPIVGSGEKLDRFLTDAIAELKGEKPRPPPPEPRKPAMRGLFFSLIDECDGSERRLDELAEPFLRELAELETRAGSVIDDRRIGIARVHDYLDRLQGTVRKLEEKKPVEKPPAAGDNKGPPLAEGSAGSPPPSSDAPPSPPASSDAAPAPGEAPPL